MPFLQLGLSTAAKQLGLTLSLLYVACAGTQLTSQRTRSTVPKLQTLSRAAVSYHPWYSILQEEGAAGRCLEDCWVPTLLLHLLLLPRCPLGCHLDVGDNGEGL